MSAAAPEPLTGDDTAALRARLADLAGPARVRPLTELGGLLANQYWQIGPGRPAGLQVLDEAIAVLEEAHGYFTTSDSWRAQVTNQLGWLIGTRHLIHGSPEADRDRSIRLIEESLPADMFHLRPGPPAV